MVEAEPFLSMDRGGLIAVIAISYLPRKYKDEDKEGGRIQKWVEY